MLVTHSFLISDKFAKSKTTSPKKNTNTHVEVPIAYSGGSGSRTNGGGDGGGGSKQNRILPRFYNQDSLSYDAHHLDNSRVSESVKEEEEEEREEKQEPFSPESLEVCLNLTGLIVGVAAFLVVQLGLVFGWTHFWQSRQKKLARHGS